MRRVILNLAATAVFSVVSVPAAVAQDASDQSHWGISGSLVPRWRFADPLADVWDLETDIKGTELRVGIVRGSDLGGDWGISYVKKTIDDNSVVQLREQACVQVPGGAVECARGPYHVTRAAGLRGVEAHLFMPFVTIKGRAQIGITVAGGIAEIRGTSDRFIEHLVVNGQTVTRRAESIGPAPFRQTLQDLPQDWSVDPIGRAELAVGFLVAPGFKIRASAGVNYPGFHWLGFHAHYLFGSR
jgi:hypothetical protein